MRHRYRDADIGITAAVAGLAYVPIAVGAPVAITAVLGLALFVAPGYLLNEVLFDTRRTGLERVIVVTVLAFCVPILGGVLLYAAGVPLHRSAWLGLLASSTLVGDAVLFGCRLLRRRRRPQPSPDQAGQRSRQHRLPTGQIVAFAIAILIAITAVGVARIGAARQHYPGFTQLWLTHRDQSATTVNLGVGNHEGRTIHYLLILLRNGHVADTWNLTLANNHTWESTPKFGNYTIVAELYRQPDLLHVYRNVAIYSTGTAGT
jgi:lysylphosphatidylglycerol synthetase-like protein (DUF2156 family)